MFLLDPPPHVILWLFHHLSFYLFLRVQTPNFSILTFYISYFSFLVLQFFNCWLSFIFHNSSFDYFAVFLYNSHHNRVVWVGLFFSLLIHECGIVMKVMREVTVCRRIFRKSQKDMQNVVFIGHVLSWNRFFKQPHWKISFFTKSLNDIRCRLRIDQEVETANFSLFSASTNEKN